MAKRIRLLLVVAVIVCSAVSARSGNAAAVTDTQHSTVPVDFLYQSPCTGDLISFTGEFAETQHLTITDSRITIVGVSDTQNVVGTDLTTGQTFHFLSALPFVTTFTYPAFFPLVYEKVLDARIVGPGPGNNEIQHFVIHETINANGEITSSVSRGSDDCH